MKTCRICHEPLVFLPLIGWCHMTIQDHDPKVTR